MKDWQTQKNITTLCSWHYWQWTTGRIQLSTAQQAALQQLMEQETQQECTSLSQTCLLCMSNSLLLTGKHGTFQHSEPTPVRTRGSLLSAMWRTIKNG